MEIRLNTPVTPDYVRAEAPQALLVALGAEPVTPPIPGIDGAKELLDEALEIFGKYEQYRKTDIAVYGLYKREYAALEAFKNKVAAQ